MMHKLLLGVFKLKRIMARWFGERRLDAPEHELYIHTSTIREYRTRANSCKKEPETCAWLYTLPSEGVFYDIGANVGAYSLIAAARGMDVVAVEPAPKNIAALHANFVRNRLRSKVTIISSVLGDTGGVLRVTIPEDSAGATAGFAEADGEVPLPRTTLDTLIEMHELQVPAALKIDVDGAESLVLKGAEKTLACDALQQVLVEVEPEQKEAVVSVMRSAGFVVESEHARGKGITNLIFVRHGVSQ